MNIYEAFKSFKDFIRNIDKNDIDKFLSYNAVFRKSAINKDSKVLIVYKLLFRDIDYYPYFDKFLYDFESNQYVLYNSKDENIFSHEDLMATDWLYGNYKRIMGPEEEKLTKWFNNQKQKGLVDMKVTTSSAFDNIVNCQSVKCSVTREELCRELNAMNEAIEKGECTRLTPKDYGDEL